MAHLGRLPQGQSYPVAQVELGRLLFFDRILSGSRDVACATCHLPRLSTTDASAVSIGTGGEGLGLKRQRVSGKLISRNSLSLINRGDPAWKAMFWDGRAERKQPGQFSSPVGQALPKDLQGLLAAQAIFPLSSRDEMRGQEGSKDWYGAPNELAGFETRQHSPQFWQALTARVLAFADYQKALAAAYPGAGGHYTVSHLLNALEAFQSVTFQSRDAPLVRFLQGRTPDLPGAALRGADLFFGKAHCDSCHSGPLLTDQDFHNLAVPQVGPGRECMNCHAETVPHRARILDSGQVPDHRHASDRVQAAPSGGNQGIASNIDFGRYLVSGKARDRFRFRTPSLWDVANTSPYMHNGCYSSLREVIQHHLDPSTALHNYQATGLDSRISHLIMRDAVVEKVLLDRLDPKLRAIPPLTKQEVDDLIEFLNSLSEPANRPASQLPPQGVPSGLEMPQ
jgi:cytochrome c peroxidase